MDLAAAPYIGIDLGTTYSCAAVYQNGKVITISCQQNEMIPSCVGYNADGTAIFGNAAKQKRLVYPEAVIYDLKWIVGRKMDDPELQKLMRKWNFMVKKIEEIPKICINSKHFHPEQVLAELLTGLRSMAEKQLMLDPGIITKALITVPVNFHENQRQAIVDAGEVAGLTVQILNEPTAAVIAYCMDDKWNETNRIVLVFDLGGQTFDVTLLNITKTLIKVVGVDGDSHLSSQDVNENLLNYCVLKFKEKNGIDLLAGKDSECCQNRDEALRVYTRLMEKCETAKRELSSRMITAVCVDEILNGFDLRVEVNRETFDKLNQPLFSKVTVILERLFRKTGMRKEQVDEIILVGGSTRISKVLDLLMECFPGKTFNTSIPPETVIAHGAAIKGAMMNGQIGFDAIEDTTSMTLNSEEFVKEDCSGIDPNCNLLCRNTKTKQEQHDFAQGIKYEITEFQKRMEKNCQTVIAGILERYDIEMNSCKFLSKDALKQAHERLETQGLQEFDIFKTEAISPTLVPKLKKEFQTALQQRLNGLLSEYTVKREPVQHKAKEIVNKWHENYIDSMKKEMKCLHSKLKESVKQNCLKEFPSEVNEMFGNQYENELKDLVDNSYEKLNAVFESLEADIKLKMAKLAAKEAEQERRRIEHEQKLRREEEDAQNVMEHCLEVAIVQMQQAFPLAVEHWIINNFSYYRMSEIGTIYVHVLKGTNDEYQERQVTHPKIWKDFADRLDKHCKGECMNALESISELLLSFNRALKKQFDIHGYFTTAKLKQTVEGEYHKIVHKTDDDFILRMCKVAMEKLYEFYMEHNRIIEETEKSLRNIAVSQLTNVYHDQMKRYLKDAPYNPERLQRIHWKLVEKLVDAFKKAFRLSITVDENIVADAEYFKNALGSAYATHKEKNESRLMKLQLEINKILQKIKTEYNQKTEEILSRNPDGLDSQTLNKLHMGIQNEVMKLLEMEITQKIRPDEPLDNHKLVLQSHINSYRASVEDANNRNLQKKREREEQEKRERKKKEAQMKLQEQEKGISRNNLSSSRGQQ